MAKPEWGTKRVCDSCGAKFYDMKRNPIVCPKCETTIVPAVTARPKRNRGPKPETAAAKPKETVEDESEDTDDIDDDEVDADDDALLDDSDDYDDDLIDVDTDDDDMEDKDN